MKRSAAWSQRLLRKGPLVEETYNLFSGWEFGNSVDDNLRKGLGGRFNTVGWEHEVAATIRRRLRDVDALKPLIVLAQNGLSLADWRDCWRLWVGATEEPFHSFATGWLYSEFQSGRYSMRSEQVRDFVRDAWNRHSPKRSLSDYGVTRSARDLLKTAAELGLLSGDGPSKTFATMAMSDGVILFYAHMIAELEGAAARVSESRLWRLAMMSPADVHSAFLRLHQFRRLDYQIAGTLVQLALPNRSALDYAESLAA